MPLLSQPWAVPESDSTRVVALSSQLPRGVGQSLVRACFFLGPFALGAMLWESISAIPFDINVWRGIVGGRKLYESGCLAPANIVACVARCAALAFLATYIAYTSGSPDLGCDSWPKALVAASAIAVSAATACFVMKAIGVARIANGVKVLLGFFVLVQLVVTLGAIPGWYGALTPSGIACYLRIRIWYGIFSLFPLFTLLLAFGTLVLGHTHHRYRLSLASQRASASTNQLPSIASPPGAAAVNMRSLSLEQKIHAQRLLQSAGLGIYGNPGEALTSSAINLERSFLKLTGDDSTIASQDEENDQAAVFFLQYGTLWGFASLCLLAGTIIAFLDLSPVLTFVYQPVLVTIPVLCASRLGSIRFGTRPRRRFSDSTRSTSTGYTSRRSPAGITRPHILALRSRHKAQASEGTSTTLNTSEKAGSSPTQFLKRHLRHSEREQNKGILVNLRKPSQTATRRKDEISRPIPPDVLVAEAALQPTAASTLHAQNGPLPSGQANTPIAKFGSVDNLQPFARSWASTGPQPPPRAKASSTTSARPSAKHDSGGSDKTSTEQARYAALSVTGQAELFRRSLGANSSSSPDTFTTNDRISDDSDFTRRPYDRKQTDNLQRILDETEADVAVRVTTEQALVAIKGATETLLSPQNPPPPAVSNGLMILRNSSDIDPAHAEDVRKGILVGDIIRQAGDSSDMSDTERSIDGDSFRRTGARRARAPRTASMHSNAPSLEHADEDDLKLMIDERGFAREKRGPALTIEDKFKLALAQRAVRDKEVEVDGQASQTESSFGPAEVSHNPRLQRLNSMGNRPRQNPFAVLLPGRPILLEDERKPSDSSDPSAITAITGNTGATGVSNDSSNSAGSKSDSLASNTSTNQRGLGKGERGAIDLPGKHTIRSTRAPPTSHKKAPSVHSESSGGRTTETNGTFGKS